jgi:protein ImuB
LSPRPLRFLARPEPIEDVFALVPTAPVRFRWRRALHEVIAVEGERIEGAPWWSEEGGPARDYFRVEDKADCASGCFARDHRDMARACARAALVPYGICVRCPATSNSPSPPTSVPAGLACRD